jgi:protein SCO1/2
VFIAGCGKGVNYARDFPYGKGYVLVNQNGDTVRLDDLSGKVLVVGYIYTHCPDVCPFITSNMKKIQKLVNADPDLKRKVLFVSVTFDPRRDKPEVLKEYAKLYRIDTSNWVLLTGDRKTIDSLMKDLAIVVEIGPMDVQVETDTVDGKPVVDTVYRYEIVHTDRIHVVDPKGKITAYFKGSTVKPDEVFKAIKKVVK